MTTQADTKTKATGWLKSNYWIILVVLSLVMMMQTCSQNGRMSSQTKELKATQAKVDSLTTVVSDLRKNTILKEDLKKTLRKNMYEWLVFEDDIDRGRLTLSDIKQELIKLDEK